MMSQSNSASLIAALVAVGLSALAVSIFIVSLYRNYKKSKAKRLMPRPYSFDFIDPSVRGTESIASRTRSPVTEVSSPEGYQASLAGESAAVSLPHQEPRSHSAASDSRMTPTRAERLAQWFPTLPPSAARTTRQRSESIPLTRIPTRHMSPDSRNGNNGRLGAIETQTSRPDTMLSFSSTLVEAPASTISPSCLDFLESALRSAPRRHRASNTRVKKSRPLAPMPF